MIVDIDMAKYRAQVQKLFNEVLSKEEQEKFLSKAVKRSVQQAVPVWEHRVEATYVLRDDEAAKGMVRVSGFNGKKPGGQLLVKGYSRALTRADYSPKPDEVTHSWSGSWPRPAARNLRGGPQTILQGGPRRYGRDVLLNPFVVKFKSGHEAIVARVKGAERFPIKQHYAMPIPDMFANEEIISDFEENFWNWVDTFFIEEVARKDMEVRAKK